MEKLPKEVILEILARLPVKCLVRFKCVSKSWLSLISDPSFAKLQFQRSSSRHTHRILYTGGSQVQSIDINASLHDDSATVKLDFPLFMMPEADVEILGSCRGFLLLLLRIGGEKLYLWNPSTSVSKQIPLPPEHYLVLYDGFCYDESTDDYLLVFTKVRIIDSIYFALGFDVFSVRSNLWEKLAVTYRGLIFFEKNKGSVLNGAIHWLFWQFGKFLHLWEAKIIAFDITTKNLREVPTPDDFNFNVYPDFIQIGVLRGCLFLTERKNYEIKIWVMKEYGVKSSWINLISLSLLRRKVDFVLPLYFTENGQLVATDGSIGLSKWTDKGKLIEYRQYCRYSFGSYSGVYTETLLSLP